MGAAVIIAAMRRREDEVIMGLRSAGATSPANARTAGDLGLDDSRAVQRLRNQAIVREAAPGKLYLDEEILRAVRTRRYRILWMLIVIALLILAAMRLGIIKS
jgi:hypothetical protein